MTKSLAQIESQIAKLERQREALKAREVAGVVARIREAIDHYGLTAKDLGFAGANSSRGKTKSAPSKTVTGASRRKRNRPTVGAIRYRDEHGNAWTGHGKRPNWFKDAIASGKKPEDLAV
ncbi:MAG: H-NS histone family protein [Burkholderiaceae bacterium]|jgi:DNA-binding protein H-NS|nr:H-NS histone family protein [Burkholderiaceae bacterium]